MRLKTGKVEGKAGNILLYFEFIDRVLGGLTRVKYGIRVPDFWCGLGGVLGLLVGPVYSWTRFMNMDLAFD